MNHVLGVAQARADRSGVVDVKRAFAAAKSAGIDARVALDGTMRITPIKPGDGIPQGVKLPLSKAMMPDLPA
jgi:hypothetical protein